MPSMSFYTDEIKLALTGGVLDLELDDQTLQRIVNSALRELQRYICSTKIVTLPYSRCINMTEYKPNAVVRVYRAVADNVQNTTESTYSGVDPVRVGLWQLTSNTGNMYNFSDYVSRYASWSTLQQIGNTLSTDLIFYYEDATKNLYINTSLDLGSNITVEYVPRYDSVEEVTSDYWIDILMRLSKAIAKVTVGRVRSKFQQSNALWANDGESILAEGNSELEELRSQLKHDSQLLYPLD